MAMVCLVRNSEIYKYYTTEDAMAYVKTLFIHFFCRTPVSRNHPCIGLKLQQSIVYINFHRYLAQTGPTVRLGGQS